jgi:hypothetical protein
MIRTHLILIAGVVAGTGMLLAGCGGHSNNSTPAPQVFTFLADDTASYVRIDRVGMPAVGTAVITNKDAYNDSDPADDAQGTWVPQIQSNVASLHSALDDDLTGAGLTPATTSESLAQAGPLIVPDTLKIDTAAASGFPNGRQLADPVVDVTLAVVLLKLGTAGQTALTLANLPLNPPANDKAFLSGFPYLAAPF